MGIMNSNVAVGVGVAAAATILAPILFPVIAGVGRPLAKSLVKGGLMLYEKGRETVAVAGEAAEDMIAEIRAEEAQRRAGPARPAGAEPAAGVPAAGAPAAGAPAAAPEAAAAGDGGVPPNLASALAGNGAAAP